MDEENNKKPVEITSDDYMKATADSNPSYYDLLRETSARDLLDQNVATQLAKEVASKNVTRTMQGMGLDNSGYGATAAALIGNKAQGEMALNSRNYINRINEINQSELAEQQQVTAQLADNIVANIGGMNNIAQIEDYLKSKGFNIQNGKITYNGNQGFSDIMLEGIQDAYTSVLNNAGLNGTSGYTNPVSLMNSITLSNGERGDKVKNEIYELYNRFADNPPANGFVARLVNGSNDKTYVNLMYRDGKWFVVSDDAYNSATSKTQIKGAKKGSYNSYKFDENGYPTSSVTNRSITGSFHDAFGRDPKEGDKHKWEGHEVQYVKNEDSSNGYSWRLVE